MMNQRLCKTGTHFDRSDLVAYLVTVDADVDRFSGASLVDKFTDAMSYHFVRDKDEKIAFSKSVSDDSELRMECQSATQSQFEGRLFELLRLGSNSEFNDNFIDGMEDRFILGHIRLVKKP